MKIALFANTEWYLFNFRRGLAQALREAGHDVLLLSPDGPYGERLRDLGFRWLPVPMNRRSLDPVRELRLLLWLVRLLRRERLDLIHGFTIKCAAYGSLAGSLARIAGRVASVAGLGHVFTSDQLRARLLRPIVRKVLRVSLGGRGVRLILQNSDDVALFTEARLAEADSIRLIRGSGVDLSRFVPGDISHQHKSFRVLLPARLLWAKGIGEFVEAGRRLRAEGAQVRLVLAGIPDDGNPAAVSEAEIRAWTDADLVEWLGHVDDMPALFREVDAVALPSYYGEGTPKSLIEAAACALPLITTDMPGCREVVTHEVDGLLIPPRDAEALAAAIARLAADPDLCRRLGTAAREKALREFDERIVVEKTLAVYGELLGQGFVGVPRTGARVCPS